MHHIIYSSRATHPMSEQELIDLLLEAREKNLAHDISGALVYGQGQFIQIMEGERSALNRLYERILDDPRHHSVFKMADKPIQRPSFSEWSMAFAAVSPDTLDQLMGYVAPEQVSGHEAIPNMSAADTLIVKMMRDLLSPSQL